MFLYNYLVTWINLAVFYTFIKKNVHVTDMTNRDRDDIVCDGYDIHVIESFFLCLSMSYMSLPFGGSSISVHFSLLWKLIYPYIGETGVSWHLRFVGTLSFSHSANYDFTKEYHLYKGTYNTHTPYHFQSCSTNTVRINQLCLIFHLLSTFFSFQKR